MTLSLWQTNKSQFDVLEIFWSHNIFYRNPFHNFRQVRSYADSVTDSYIQELTGISDDEKASLIQYEMEIGSQ